MRQHQTSINGTTRPAADGHRNGSAAPADHLVVSPDTAGFGEALELVGADLRYNVRAARYEICFNRAVAVPLWKEANDRVKARLFELIASRCKFLDGDAARGGVKLAMFSGAQRKQVIDAYGYGHEVDPFELWLDGLPAWDRAPRLDYLLISVFDVRPGQDKGLVAWVSASVPMTAVWRCKRPGYQQDVVPVLIGPQGIGKSTLLRALLPEDREEWFGDGVSLVSNDKARVEATQGRVIVELSEMSGSTKPDLEQIKAYISRRNDGSIRLAYRSDPESMPRRFALAATTNDRSCLPSDPSGLRRFAPVEVDAKVVDGKRQPASSVRDWCAKYGEQVWAEAVARYEAGAVPSMPFELEIGAAAEQAERFRNADEVLENRLGEWVAGRREAFTLAKALESAGYRPDVAPTSADGKRVARALQQLGCTRTKIDDRRMWQPPPAD